VRVIERNLPAGGKQASGLAKVFDRWMDLLSRIRRLARQADQLQRFEETLRGRLPDGARSRGGRRRGDRRLDAASFTVLFVMVGDRVKLTAAGYLPPAVCCASTRVGWSPPSEDERSPATRSGCDGIWPATSLGGRALPSPRGRQACCPHSHDLGCDRHPGGDGGTAAHAVGVGGRGRPTDRSAHRHRADRRRRPAAAPCRGAPPRGAEAGLMPSPPTGSRWRGLRSPTSDHGEPAAARAAPW
jgi:hypothetical protein